jgi:hypothetical protein
MPSLLRVSQTKLKIADIGITVSPSSPSMTSLLLLNPFLNFHSMLLVSACTGQQAIDAYCDYHVEAMDMYARKYKLNFVQVMQLSVDPLRF